MANDKLANKIFFLNRATFGFTPTRWDEVQQLDQMQLVKNAFQNESAFNKIGSLSESVDAKYLNDFRIVKPLTPELRRTINTENVDELKKLTLQWMQLMVDSQDQLREKIALFWHGHFACRMQNAYFQQNMLNDIRQNALGNFKDLLFAVSKSAAMLNFLNNQQNKKAHPNENFAREVMELFTLGRGNYTEMDIKEAARAFTGWEYDKDGNFRFNAKVHDNGAKAFRGKTGNFNGEDILNMLLADETTAYFITKKLYKYIVNPEIDNAQVQKLAKQFYANNYDISSLLTQIFTSQWFYSKKNRDAIIKSPVELLVGIQRNLPMTITTPNQLLTFNNALGQQPFYPPNVAGWPGGTNWIDASTLMLRLKIPQLIEQDRNIQINTKTDDDIQMGRAKKVPRKGNNIEANIDLSAYSFLNNIDSEEKEFELVTLLLLGDKKSNFKLETIQRKIKKNSKDDYLKSMIVAIMSTPEYQLC
ncbi:DUF1800 domain-containing protein [Rhizosphaericola mali]|uniref:DUF1800 domain-containing protein n=1 Tax=Rhizosphaericola mali TaxID=2545455 RepID=A0A5P2G8U3_9BACT|nr:DUF1800 domain-containing protein [Rhizosphaericola mali]QES90352.1 DUF1800 domain-containing protein [Rhizosphaericola mali]